MWQKQKNQVDTSRILILVAVTGVWSAGILLASLTTLPPFVPLMGACIALILLLLLRHDQWGRNSMLLILCLCTAAWRYSIALPENDPQAIANFIGTNIVQVRGTVADEPKIQGHTRLLLVTVASVSRNSGQHWDDAHGQLTLQTLSTTIEDPYGANYGDVVQIQGKLTPPPPHSPPNIFASMSFSRVTVSANQGNPIIAFLYHLRITFATIITQSLPQPEAALLIAIVFGLRTPALKPLTLAFNATGLAHLVAPSGFKVTILSGLVANGTKWLHTRSGEQLLPAEKRRDWRLWLSTTLMIVSIIMYTVLSGAGSAALRAGIMGSILVIAPRLGRNYNVYTALALSAFLMSCFDPFVLWDIGFQLSFLGTLGIVLLTPFFQRLLHFGERLPSGYLITEITAVTLAAQIATLPINAVTFQQISFIGPLANLLTVPLLGILILLGVTISIMGSIFAPLGLLAGWIAWPILWYVQTVVIWSASIPGAYLNVSTIGSDLAWLYYILLACGVYILFRKELVSPQTQQKHPLPFHITPGTWKFIQLGLAGLIIAVTGIATLTAQSNKLLTITFFDVAPAGQASQGEAILIHTPEGKTILIDGGPDIGSLSQRLDSYLPPWQRSLDIVILTTPRPEHITGLQDIITRYTIGAVIDAGMLHPNTTYARWRRNISERNLQYLALSRGATIPIESQIALQIIWPTTHLHKGSNEVRDNSLIIRLVAPGLSLLLLGAIAQSPYALSALMTDFTAASLQSEIVQIVGEIDKPVPVELIGVLQKVRPSLLVVTPALLTATERKMGSLPTHIPPELLTSIGLDRQTVQTAQIGTCEITSSINGWNMNVL